jgi:KDO2-lipid IV(A) lauroyltransferase
MYYSILLLLYPLSLLPLWALYGLSDLCCFILFRVFSYRKKIVLSNLKHAFPEKTKGELERIIREFYHSFCDQWVETLKLLSIPLKSLDKRIEGNYEVFDRLFTEQKDVYALLGHQFNWEWGNVATQRHIKAQFAGIYLPQNSTTFDRFMLKIRGRSGSVLVAANDMRDAFKKLRAERHVIGFMADQTPGSMRIADWFDFMNRPAPFFKGPEKTARRAKAAVVLVSLRKIKRGHYRLHFTRVCENAAETPEGYITKKYVAHLENELRHYPSNWMWTHRRWKKALPPDVEIIEK